MSAKQYPTNILQGVPICDFYSLTIKYNRFLFFSAFSVFGTHKILINLESYQCFRSISLTVIFILSFKKILYLFHTCTYSRSFSEFCYWYQWSVHYRSFMTHSDMGYLQVRLLNFIREVNLCFVIWTLIITIAI